ncbi:hypothetical protein DFA_06375 [Cavenderia fasciculata]|uniref:Uncharacterized protein n=1 Tax=Cavenderia fasciculata TaxID=261658 RepID=F4PKV3_CACFS|nr:uncharacterized protein DFA_06375 [Cavenderia fasciculata]EGG24227.1 hypothetical protein DFA_06375 [Cavenderia fasciculata]|eukprot:XP_004362078.1 hypothetical protein DFA_06375 [Cavenderia fasciculata]
MFEGSNSANHLCDLNGWNKRDLRIHALLGLKYRQLEVVEPARTQIIGSRSTLEGSRLLIVWLMIKFDQIWNFIFKDVKERWSMMEEHQIIKESLNNNNTITTALSYINWKHEKNKQQRITNQDDDNIISFKGKMFRLEDFKRIAKLATLFEILPDTVKIIISFARTSLTSTHVHIIQRVIAQDYWLEKNEWCWFQELFTL